MAPLSRYFPLSNQDVFNDDEFGYASDENLRTQEEILHQVQEQTESIRLLILQQIEFMSRIMEHNTRNNIGLNETGENFQNNRFLRTKMEELETFLENVYRLLNRERH